MGKPVLPKCFLIAHTALHGAGITGLLGELGIPDWGTEAASPAEWLTEFAGKSCYMSFDLSLNQNLTKVGTRSNEEYIQGGIVGQRHGSVLEHSTATFFLKDVSRIVTHELVRHRVGTAYSQTSGRYVRLDEVDFYVPQCIANNPAALNLFLSEFRRQETAAQLLAKVLKLDESKDFAYKKECTSAIRRIIGNGQATNIVVTGNHRSWRHMIAMRTALGAEEEIRVTFALVAQELKERFPAIYADMTEKDGVYSFEHEKV